MNYWDTPGVAGLILVCVLLLTTRAVRVALAGDRPVPVPDALLAGVLGLGLGPSALGLVRFEPADLEPVVYHGLALTFITFGLRTSGSSAGSGRRSVRGLTFAIPLGTFAQGALGLAFVLAWSALFAPLHPGFGWLLALGFAQGPGQALAMGAVYERHGLAHGAQLGLITAAIGFGWAVAVGIPLIAAGRRFGWLSPSPPPPPAPPGGDAGEGSDLVLHVALVGSVYALAWAMLSGLSSRFPADSTARATLYGFHYAAGAVLALATRSVIRRLPRGPALHDGHLASLTALTVDITTASALAAIRLDAVADGLLPLLALTTLGGVATLALSLAIARLTHTRDWFEHAVVFFGTMTGTLPTGLALLRTVDPHLTGPAGRNQVMGSALALPIGVPLVVLMPMVLSASLPTVLALTATWSVVLLAGWAWARR